MESGGIHQRSAIGVASTPGGAERGKALSRADGGSVAKFLKGRAGIGDDGSV